MALALGKQVKALGIELAVVDGGIYINHLADVEAEEAAATALVGEQGVAVAGADERGYARQRGGIAGVCLAHAQRGHLHQVLQRALLACRVAVILIEVDEQAVRQAALTLALGREVEVVRVEHPQLGRQQQSAEGALVPSLLLADEDGRHAVRIERIVLALCLRHEGQQPATEVAHHHLILREATHEGADAVHAIPHGQRAEEVLHRMVVRDMHRLYGRAQSVDLPELHPLPLQVRQPGAVHTLRDRPVLTLRLILAAILRLLRQHIIPEVIVPTDKLLQLGKRRTLGRVER